METTRLLELLQQLERGKPVGFDATYRRDTGILVHKKFIRLTNGVWFKEELILDGYGQCDWDRCLKGDRNIYVIARDQVMRYLRERLAEDAKLAAEASENISWLGGALAAAKLVAEITKGQG